MSIKISIAVMVVLFFYGCAAPVELEAPFAREEYDETRNRSLAQVEVARSSGYLRDMAMLWTQEQLPNRVRCSGRSVELYLTIEADGTVSRVIGEPWGRRSACYARAYTEMKVIEPPVSPFFFHLQIQ